MGSILRIYNLGRLIDENVKTVRGNGIRGQGISHEMASEGGSQWSHVTTACSRFRNSRLRIPVAWCLPTSITRPGKPDMFRSNRSMRWVIWFFYFRKICPLP